MNIYHITEIPGKDASIYKYIILISNMSLKEILGAGKYSYIRCGSWSGYDPTWYPIYDYPLGEPLGNATLEADGVWRRYFKSGTIVTFDTNKEEGTIKWSNENK